MPDARGEATSHHRGAAGPPLLDEQRQGWQRQSDPTRTGRNGAHGLQHHPCPDNTWHQACGVAQTAGAAEVPPGARISPHCQCCEQSYGMGCVCVCVCVVVSAWVCVFVRFINTFMSIMCGCALDKYFNHYYVFVCFIL